MPARLAAECVCDCHVEVPRELTCAVCGTHQGTNDAGMCANCGLLHAACPYCGQAAENCACHESTYGG